MKNSKFRFGKPGKNATSLIDKYYRGKSVTAYEDKRKRNPKWTFEEHGLETALSSIQAREKKTIGDIPVGTNRFYQLLNDDANIELVYCIDYSADMLTASMERSSSKFFYSKCDMIEEGTPIVADTVISFRFLNLFDFPTIEKILGNLCAASRRNLIFSIRLAATPEEVDTVFQNKIHIHSRERFEESLATNDFAIAWQEGRKDEKPGEYFIVHARRND